MRALAVPLLLCAAGLPVCGAVAAPPRAPARARLAIDLRHPLGGFRPDRALGAGVDGHDKGDTRLIYTPQNLRAMRSAGLGPLAYRLRTELGVEAWHWNRRGTWSDPVHHRGYWTGSSAPGPASEATYGYRLPRRGDSVDQANDDGYSRLDDGSLRSFWKSDPYLDPHFTHESDALHPQWILVDLGRARPVDAIRLAWGAPYARAVRAQYFVGGDPTQFADSPGGHWLPFADSAFKGHAGTQTLRVERSPRSVRFLRVLLRDSSHTGPPRSHDVRDRLGFAVRELWVGTIRDGRLHDVVRHVPDGGRQTVTYVSSTDPWHRASDIDPHTEQPSFTTVLRSGLLGGAPMLTPVPVLYGTPADAVAELRYAAALHLPVRRVEMGEEPDGQLVTPEDYGALYAEFARALHGAFPRLQLGGPGYQTSIPDWMSPATRPGGDISWTRRFLEELRRQGQARALGFFSFEWYPFDDGCAPPAPQLAQAPSLLDEVVAAQRAEGLPRRVPMLMTEYGYSAFATRDMVDMPGALLDADIVGRFLSDGGDVAYLYGYEPDALIEELPQCRTWGNLILWLSDDRHVIRQPVATYWSARLVTREWAQPGHGVNELYRARVAGAPLVSAYALRRPDRRVAVLLVNRDPRRGMSLDVPLRGPLDVFSLSSAQYVWHPRGEHGFARPDRPPAHAVQPAGTPVALPPWSVVVVRSR